MDRFLLVTRWKYYTHRAYPMLSAGVTQVFAVVTFMLAARWLAPAELGSWAMFLTLASLVEMARLGLVQAALVHFSAHCPAGERPFLRVAALLASLGASLAGAILIGVMGCLFNQIWHLPGLSALLALFPVVALITAPLRWHDALRMAAQDFRGIFLAALYYGVAYLALLFLGKHFLGKISLFSLLWLQIPAAALTILFRSKTLWADFVLESVTLSKSEMLHSWLLKIWQFGRFGLGSNLFSMLFQRADVLLLGAFVSPVGLATYNVASRLVTWLDFPLNALSQACLPKIAAENQLNGPSGVSRMYQKSVKTLLTFALPLSIAAFFGADVLVKLLAGDAFPEAANLLRILLLANLAKPFGRMLGVVLDATGQPSANFRMVLLSLGMNLILLVCLLPVLGTIGAAVASTVGVYLTTAAGQWFFKTQKLWSPSLQ